MISHAELLERLHYDPITGQFTWRVTRGRAAKAGDVAGSPDRDGYTVIYLRADGRQHAYRAHRLAWFYIYGSWPDADIDHISPDRKDDNRLIALREATRSQNMANTLAHKDSRTGVKGVTYDRRRGKYCARIMKEGKKRWLGSFDTAAAAGAAYAASASELFGEFARSK